MIFHCSRALVAFFIEKIHTQCNLNNERSTLRGRSAADLKLWLKTCRIKKRERRGGTRECPRRAQIRMHSLGQRPCKLHPAPQPRERSSCIPPPEGCLPAVPGFLLRVYSAIRLLPPQVCTYGFRCKVQTIRKGTIRAAPAFRCDPASTGSARRPSSTRRPAAPEGWYCKSG